jgi:hypothetical protein
MPAYGVRDSALPHTAALVKTMVLTDGTLCVASIVLGDKRLERK